MIKKIFVVLAVYTLFLVLGCGGGGGGGNSGGEGISKAISIKGTAATGKPIANAVITLKDKNGKIETVKTDENGKFLKQVEMTLPIIMKVSFNGKDYYSIVMQEGVTNIHPFTDLIVRQWYIVKGLDINQLFNSNSQINHYPTLNEIKTIESVVKDVISQIMAYQGIDATKFSLFNTEFDTNGKGFDGVLDTIKVTESNSNYKIVVVDKNGNEVDTLVTITPTTDIINSIAKQKEEINNILADFKNVINNKGCNNLTETDVEAFFEQNWLWQGMKIKEFLDQIKDFALDCRDSRKGVIEEAQLISVDKINEDGVIEGTVKFTRKVSNVSSWVKTKMYFKKEDNRWKLASDGKVTYIRFQINYSQHIEENGSSTNVNIDIKVYDRLDNVNYVTVTGPGISGSLELYKYCDLTDNNRDNDIDCEDDGFAKREFKGQINSGFYSGAVYFITVKTKDNTEHTYKVVLLPIPEEFTYPWIRNLNPQTHTLSFVNGKMKIEGEQYIPLFVQEIPAPFFTLWGQNDKKIISVYDGCKWDYTPILGQYNKFSCEIPETYGGETVTKAILGTDALGNDYGGVKSHIFWEFK